jgi:hypothetical protein
MKPSTQPPWSAAACRRFADCRDASKFRRRGEPSLARSRTQPASTTQSFALERRRQVAALQKSPRQGIWSCKGGSAGEKKAIREPGALDGRDFSPAAKTLGTVGLLATEVGW